VSLWEVIFLINRTFMSILPAVFEHFVISPRTLEQSTVVILSLCLINIVCSDFCRLCTDDFIIEVIRARSEVFVLVIRLLNVSIISRGTNVDRFALFSIRGCIAEPNMVPH